MINLANYQLRNVYRKSLSLLGGSYTKIEVVVIVDAHVPPARMSIRPTPPPLIGTIRLRPEVSLSPTVTSCQNIELL